MPFSQAVKLPIWCKLRNGIWPKYHRNGKIIIESDCLSFGMIELGVMQYPEYRGGMYFLNNGTIVFKGCAHVSNETFLKVYRGGYLEIGDGVGISQSNITCVKSITLGKGVFAGIGCYIADSDFHPIIDVIGKCYLNPTQSISIGDYNWLGAEVMVLKGAKTPRHCIVSARSILNRKYRIPECSIINNSCGNEIILEGYIRDRFIESIENRKSRKIDDFEDYYKKLLDN